MYFFYIDGTKNTKTSFWSLKKYKVFYAKFHSAQQNKLYALIQVICLCPYPINIVSDSTYCFCIKKYRNLHHKLLVLLKDKGPAYISRHFKQFLQSFSIKHITGIPYNPQAQGIVK